MSGSSPNDSNTPKNPSTAAPGPADPASDRDGDAQQATPADAASGLTGATDSPATDSVTDLENQLMQAEEKIAQYHDELLRARAEVENIRRRSQDDVAKARKFGIESFAENLVPVIDSLEAALAQSGQDAGAWQEGVEATRRQLISAFERNAMKEVAPQAGDRFDPHVHQAISSIPSDQPEGCVAQLLQKGYTLADRVLRPALVMVSAGSQGG